MLSPIKDRPPKIRRFLVYDLEWTTRKIDNREKEFLPTLRMAGVFDGNKYRRYWTIQDFLQNELTRENNGRWFYAHAGGLADMIFLLEVLAKDDNYDVKGCFSGSSAIIVKIRRKGSPHVWWFLDSYWLLRDKLANIATWIGEEKGKVDFNTENLQELVEYNQQDCVVLHKAINAMENVLLGLGGQLQMTLASSAMILFRRAFLKREINTSEALNDAAALSYVASRVEVIKPEAIGVDLFYWDINSSFPFAMTKPCPGNLTQTTNRLTMSQFDQMVLVDAEILVPEGTYLPPLPYRHKQGVYFPTGQWRAWFTGPDLQLLLETGGSIIKMHEAKVFEAFTDLAEYAETLYNLRKKSTTLFEKQGFKLLLNSLYGKFGEREIKSSLHLHPSFATTCPMQNCHSPPKTGDEACGCMEMLFPGAWLIEEKREIAHRHVIISSYITAYARKALYDYMEPADPYYCDTDGFATRRGDLPSGNALGALKLELSPDPNKAEHNARFIRPKLYELEGVLNDKGEVGDKVKAKGFSLKPRKEEVKRRMEEIMEGKVTHDESPDEEAVETSMAVDRFKRILAGEEIEVFRFARIREAARRGQIIPTERIIKKALRNKVRPKRKYQGADSRPWTVDEIEKR